MNESLVFESAASDQPVNAASADAPLGLPPASKKHKARIEHKVPGRIRMRIPHSKADPTILDAYQRIFSSIPGVAKVKAKPSSGSIVIHYDPAREAEFEKQLQACTTQHNMSLTSARPGDEIEAMASKIQAEAEFLAERSELAKSTVELCKKLDRELKLATGNTIDLKIVLAGGLAAYTFLEIGADAATPMWVTLGLFSLNHFAELHVPPLDQPASTRALG